MKTDIDRLHKVALGELTGRQVGKTYLQCHNVAGLIEIGSFFIVCKIKFSRDTFYIWPMLNDVLNEHGINSTLNKANFKIITDTSKILFVQENNFYDKTRGLGDFDIVDFVDY